MKKIIIALIIIIVCVALFGEELLGDSVPLIKNKVTTIITEYKEEKAADEAEKQRIADNYSGKTAITTSRVSEKDKIEGTLYWIKLDGTPPHEDTLYLDNEEDWKYIIENAQIKEGNYGSKSGTLDLEKGDFGYIVDEVYTVSSDEFFKHKEKMFDLCNMFHVFWLGEDVVQETYVEDPDISDSLCGYDIAGGLDYDAYGQYLYVQ